VITHVSTQEPVAALTFDDGPHPEYTPRLLEILDRFGVSATFFMVGEAAAKNSELVRQVGERHVIANHSWDHPVFTEISSIERQRQIRECADAIAPYDCRLFRPPHGAETRDSRRDAELIGYRSIGWNVDAEDWMAREPEWMASRLLKDTTPGSIVLMHDAIFKSRQPVPQYDRQPMLEAVAMFLLRLGGRVRFLSVPELLSRGPVVTDETQ